ncbi:MAG: hypothetical protein SFV52_09010, partial [Saprospiraceae bacterium]|nr:hypothetical protein [Saprospiraceae bacterium]
MRNLYFFALLAGLLLPAGGWGQPGFNQAYDYGYPRNQFYKILVVNDTVVAYGLARQDTSPSQQCLFVARLDSSGQQIDHRLICHPDGWPYAADMLWSSISATTDGGYALTAFTFSTYDGMMVKLRADLSVEFIRVFRDSVNLVEFYRFVVERPNGYLLTGDVQRPNFQLQPFIRKVDKTGETEWFMYVGDEALYDNFPGIDTRGDTLLLVGGQIDGDITLPENTSPRIMLFDMHEEDILYEQVLSGREGDYFISGRFVEDMGFIAQGLKLTSTQPLNRYLPFVLRADTNWNIQNTLYGTTIPNSGPFLRQIIPMTDSTLLAVGQQASANPNVEVGSYGWLWAFSSSADSLWELKMYAPLANGPNSGHYLGGVGRLSSGNLIAGGYASSLGNVYPWLVKITPDGCVDDLWCAPVVSAAPEPAYAVPALEVRVYPNPASGWVQLELPFL